MSSDANQSGPGSGKHADHFVAEWRERRELTQAELGAMVGASHSKISRLETGETELKPSFAKKLARFFDIPLVALFTVNPMGEGRDTADMLDVWARVHPRNRARAIRSLEVFADDEDTKQSG